MAYTYIVGGIRAAFRPIRKWYGILNRAAAYREYQRLYGGVTGYRGDGRTRVRRGNQFLGSVAHRYTRYHDETPVDQLRRRGQSREPTARYGRVYYNHRVVNAAMPIRVHADPKTADEQAALLAALDNYESALKQRTGSILPRLRRITPFRTGQLRESGYARVKRNSSSFRLEVGYRLGYGRFVRRTRTYLQGRTLRGHLRRVARDAAVQAAIRYNAYKARR